MNAEYFVFVGSCNEKGNPPYCEGEVAVEPCLTKECPYLEMECVEDAMVVIQDDA